LASRLLLKIADGDKVAKGDQLSEGHLDIKQYMDLKGEQAVQRYIVDEIQNIYSLQGVNISDKHVEIIIRQMFSKTRIKTAGDSGLVAGEIIERRQFEKIARELKEAGKKPPKGEHLLLGVTRSALNTESFLSSASFQETTRVLVDAAIMGKIDYLRGLKENVIIGRLIPAGTGLDAEPEPTEGEAE
jgi:DNA-directed RNA polymerase subunit beta'